MHVYSVWCFFLPDFVYFFSFCLSFCRIICKFVGNFIIDSKTDTNIQKTQSFHFRNPELFLLNFLSSFFIELFYQVILPLLWWGGVIDYIMPPIPGAPPIGIAGSGAGLSQITDSVVRNSPATEAAFSSATRATFAGSMIPAFFMSS